VAPRCASGRPPPGSCRQTIRGPYTQKCGSHTRRISTRSPPSRGAHRGQHAGSACAGWCGTSVDVAIGNAAQLSSTLHWSRWSVMNPTITSLGGQAPLGQDARTLSARCRSPAYARDTRVRTPSAAAARRSQSRPADQCPAWPGSTHGRSVSMAQPGFEAVASTAAHRDRCTTPCWRAIRTPRTRTSGDYRLGRPRGSLLSTDGCSPGLSVSWTPSAGRGGFRY